MHGNDLSRLRPNLFGEKTLDVALAVREVETFFPLPTKYKELLAKMGGAIMFANGARYKPTESTPLTKKDGYNNLESLFGIGNEKYSIKRAMAQYENDLPAKFIPIGEAPGGNLICIGADQEVFLWDHETGQLWRVALSLDRFLESLEPDNVEPRNTHGVIESESFLNF